MPRNSNGNRIIWEIKGWICPYCKDCIKKDMKGDWLEVDKIIQIKEAGKK